MTLAHRLASIARWLFRRDTVERELDDELQAFIEASAADKERTGVTRAEARRLATLELGGVEQAKERVRTYRHGALVDELGRDLRYAARIFVKTPVFTAAIVITLALGIGANTVIFSLIDALMLRWLPVREPEELVLLTLQAPDDPGPGGESFSYAIVRALANQTDVFSGVTGFSGFTFSAGARGDTTPVSGAIVTGGYFETFGLTPEIGRLLSPHDDEAGAPLVVVLSHGYWERAFGRDPAVVGRTLTLNGVPVTIVGVSPSGFVGANVGMIANVTVPVAALPSLSPEAAPLLGPGNFWLRMLARPRPGMPRAEAEARLAAVWPRMAEDVLATHWPASRRQDMADDVFRLTPGGTGWTFLRNEYSRSLLILMGAVGLVLTIACANVASLLLARASARQREIAVRLAIGAGRGRIVRQLLTESLLLSITGAAAGICLAWWAGPYLLGLISTAPVFDLMPNRNILAFTAAIATATGVAFGLAPALHITAAGPGPALKADARMTRKRSRLLPSLVSAQVALSAVLLVAGGLFLRTLQNLNNFDPGFDPNGVLLVDFEGHRTGLSPALLDDVRRVSGVVSASVSTHTPLSGSLWSEPAVPLGQPLPERDTALFVGASPEFFATMGIPLVAGRGFTDRDDSAGAHTAIVNERFAAHYFPGTLPIGERLSAKLRDHARELEIVGVVKDVYARSLRDEAPRTVYVPYLQIPGSVAPGSVWPLGVPTTLEVRVSGPIGQVAATLESALRAQMPDATIDVRPLAAQVGATLAQERMMATLAAALGVLAVVLASVGLYGLLAYGVAQRAKEIGLRLALGARPARVMLGVLGGAARLVGAGLVVGLPVAWGAARFVRTMLFGLTPTDPIATVTAVATLVSAALVAAYLPARRASRLDPVATLRHD